MIIFLKEEDLILLYDNYGNSMKQSMKIGSLLSAMQEYLQTALVNDQEVRVSDLAVKIQKPCGQYTTINYIIKKQSSGVKLFFDNNNTLTCASKHMIYDQSQLTRYACNFAVGDRVLSQNGYLTVDSVQQIPSQDFYDIGIDTPHVYCDSAGILHHNTLITAALSQRCQPHGRTIVIVPNKSLVTQTERDYQLLELDVGVWFGDRKESGHQHTICTWQSLNILLKNTKNQILAESQGLVTIGEFIQGVVAVIVDECHQIKADSLTELLVGPMSQIPIRWALTGTIPKIEYEWMSLLVAIGPVVKRLTAVELQEKGILSQCHVNIRQLIDHGEYRDYQSELKYLVDNADRMGHIAQMIHQISQSGNTLVLVDRLAAGEHLCSALPDAVFISGKNKVQDRKDHYDTLAVSNNQITVATYGVASVGIDIPRLFNVVLIEPGKSFVRTIQSIGRGLRRAQDKDSVQIWDITSTMKFSKRHLTQRKKWYEGAEYPYSTEKVHWQ